MAGRGGENALDHRIGEHGAPAPLARFAHEVAVVLGGDAPQGHLAAQAEERAVFFVEHRRQQMPLAAGEKAGDVAEPLDGVTDRAFETAPFLHGTDLLELVQNQQGAAAIQAGGPVQARQGFGDALPALALGLELHRQSGRTHGELRHQRAERLAKTLRRRTPARRKFNAQARHGLQQVQLHVVRVVRDEQIDRGGGNLAAGAAKIFDHLFQQAGLAHAPPTP